MRKLIISLIILLIGCKNDNTSCKNEQIEKNEKNSEFIYKEIGKISIMNTNFPNEWFVNTYDDLSKKIKKEDLNYQKVFADLDYFDAINGKKLVDRSFFNTYVKNDSILRLSKIEKFDLLDSIEINTKKIFYIKSKAVIDNGEYDMPLIINKIDLVMFNKSEFYKSINIYLELNYPYSTIQNLGYLSNKGILYYKKFKIDEDKTCYFGMSKINVDEYFKNPDNCLNKQSYNNFFGDSTIGLGKEKYFKSITKQDGSSVLEKQNNLYKSRFSSFEKSNVINAKYQLVKQILKSKNDYRIILYTLLNDKKKDSIEFYRRTVDKEIPNYTCLSYLDVKNNKIWQLKYFATDTEIILYMNNDVKKDGSIKRDSLYFLDESQDVKMDKYNLYY